MTVVNQNDTTQFMVYDFDFGLLADTRVGLTTVARGDSGSGFVGTWDAVNKPACFVPYIQVLKPSVCFVHLSPLFGRFVLSTL